MKVVFGNLEDMLQELREKEISDVRVEALYDKTFSERGVPLLKVYVTAQALLSPTLFAHYEKITFKGVQPFPKEELKSLFDKNRQEREEIEKQVREAKFWVRAGHFEE